MGHALQIALIGFSVLLAVLPSHAQRRVALVIGNSTQCGAADCTGSRKQTTRRESDPPTITE
jgi:hypothetical protein